MSTMINRNFFQDRRESLGFTQRHIADLLRMTSAAVSSWECGRTIPDVALFERLATIYQVSPERIAKEVMALARRREPQPA